MPIILIPNFFIRVFENIFKIKRHIKLGFYGPPNGGKTTLANRICKDWTGEELGTVSKIPHETREVQVKEKVDVKFKKKELTFKVVDTPGIATRIDYEDFMKFGLNKKDAKERAKEATRGVIESIKWLDDMDAVVIVLDGTLNPYTQVNITIIGNLAARKIPVLIVANKIDLKKTDVKKIEAAFPEYEVVGYLQKMEQIWKNFTNHCLGLQERANENEKIE